MALADLGILGCLLALLVTAVRHPSGRVEVLVGLVAALATLATGVLDEHELRVVVTDLAPVLVFLVAILVVADVCARAGLFGWAAGLVLARAGGRRRGVRLFNGMFVLAAVVTIVFSLDATVVLLAPVAVGASRLLGGSSRPHTYACLRLANSASVLLPISNLTNLLAFGRLDLTFLDFAEAMAPVLSAVLVVEYVGLRWLWRDDLAHDVAEAAASPTAAGGAAPPAPVVPPGVPLAVVVLMLAGFAVTSPLDIAPFWTAAVAALVLVGWALRARVARPGELVHATHASFAFLVLCLAIVVAALSRGFLAEWLDPLVPDSTGWLALLGIALLTTAASAALTNLSATLLLVPALAPLGATAVLAGLLGLNIGAGITWTGSLANLLWRRTLRRHDLSVSSAEFHRVALTLTPVSLLVGVTVLWLTA